MTTGVMGETAWLSSFCASTAYPMWIVPFAVTLHGAHYIGACDGVRIVLVESDAEVMTDPRIPRRIRDVVPAVDDTATVLSGQKLRRWTQGRGAGPCRPGRIAGLVINRALLAPALAHLGGETVRVWAAGAALHAAGDGWRVVLMSMRPGSQRRIAEYR